ncbi:MAG: hypothetical protein COB36_11185 [Alphaproteobacteria bacterium]|nr:MAG: hypothetical protein COB36_11185 [Alphaproteobacteria bacterium]
MFKGKSKPKIILFFLLLIGCAFSLYFKQYNTLEVKQYNEGNKMVSHANTLPPPTKIPPISMNAGPLLRAVLERVWVTKYFGAPAEIYKFNSDMPLCESLPESDLKQDAKHGVFIWWHKCLPLEIQWEVNKEDKSGTAKLRMLYFDKADEVLEDAFKIIRTNSLGDYSIEEEKKDAIKKIIKEETKPSKFPINYTYKLKTYSKLEDYHFLEDEIKANPDTTDDFEKRVDNVRKYFSNRGKKYALTLGYNPAEFVKKGNVIEYSLTAPIGFFGMEKDYEKGRMK